MKQISILAFLFFLAVPVTLYSQTAPGIEWQKCLGGTRAEYGSSSIQTKDGGYAVCGSATSSDGDVTGLHSAAEEDIWVVKLNASGRIEWQKCLGGTGIDRGSKILQTSDGGYAIIGT